MSPVSTRTIQEAIGSLQPPVGRLLLLSLHQGEYRPCQQICFIAGTGSIRRCRAVCEMKRDSLNPVRWKRGLGGRHELCSTHDRARCKVDKRRMGRYWICNRRHIWAIGTPLFFSPPYRNRSPFSRIRTFRWPV